MLFEVRTDWCVGENETRGLASFEEALDYAKSLRDPNHMADGRAYRPVQIFGPEFGRRLFERGILARVDITRLGCVDSRAEVLRRN